ncbi:hypothetical protein PR002_g22230 [Phytophthora rubi]|uniref:Uncharacterized protein n=1 Tax=Phytophthora rubi TaxID=129364 RepID=A0A6A3IXT7_9STRA|nr:hypothetical protein PR002_g22230 [Phytophthora rubi]
MSSSSTSATLSALSPVTSSSPAEPSSSLQSSSSLSSGSSLSGSSLSSSPELASLSTESAPEVFCASWTSASCGGQLSSLDSAAPVDGALRDGVGGRRGACLRSRRLDGGWQRG